MPTPTVAHNRHRIQSTGCLSTLRVSHSSIHTMTKHILWRRFSSHILSIVKQFQTSVTGFKSIAKSLSGSRTEHLLTGASTALLAERRS